MPLYLLRHRYTVCSDTAYLRHNFWPGLVYRDLDDLNQQCRHWLETVANERIHATTQVAPQTRLVQEGLLSLVGKPDYDTTLVSSRRSTKDCLVSYKGNYYSVPALYAQQTVMLKETEQNTLLILTPEGIEVAAHHLAEGCHQRVIRNSHYAHLNTHTHIPTKGGALQLPQEDTLALSWPAPQVEIRPLRQYETWVEAISVATEMSNEVVPFSIVRWFLFR